MHVRLAGLWRSRDFLRLWAAQTLSRFGSQITFLALPLAAVLVLDATPMQVGILTAAGGLPALVIGPLVGAWVDRRHRRPVLIAADWGRAALLLAVPTMAVLDVLRIEFLYLLAFGLGAMGLFFDVAYRSFLPVLAGRARIVEANSKLEVSRSAAEIAGPAAGGALVQLVTAPIALMADSITFLASALLLHGVRTPSPSPRTLKGEPVFGGKLGRA